MKHSSALDACALLVGLTEFVIQVKGRELEIYAKKKGFDLSLIPDVKKQASVKHSSALDAWFCLWD